ncbi:MAG: ferredoxin [Shimia sp.]
MEPGTAVPQALTDGARLRGLMPFGTVDVTEADDLPGLATLLLLSPGPAFWPVFTASHEYQGGLPDPMDRWSRRVIGRWARELGARTLFPFDGPPYRPFFAWATRSGRAAPSPVTLLVGEAMGLDTSFRGALGLRERIVMAPSPTPCIPCAEPCATACPVEALTPAGYDVPRCRAYLIAEPESACRTGGCLVRRACPAGPGQSAAQARFHMEAFLR